MPIRPAHRIPIAALAVAVSIAPAIGFFISKGQTQGTKHGDEAQRLERLTTVTQDEMARKCYVYVGKGALSKGAIVTIPDAVPASSCVKDDRRFGFIGVVKGRVTVLEAFSPQEIESEKSILVKGKSNAS
jgi:hypothetical protein